ncbi:MAG: baseplate assembly protein [Armatimonadetes bacterium]|nr:baseplate assembly protein [Armatimonadota bacterium]
MAETFFGKYRGLVLNNIDPESRGRIQVQVPDVKSLLPTTFAEPCFPFTGIQSGMFVVPMIGASVWVEFEHGDPDYPIWTGGWFPTAADVPALAQTPPGVQGFCINTVLQNTLLISDVPGAGGIMLKTTTGAMIKMDDTGIIIQNGKGAIITMNGPTVTVNAGALVVT